MTRACLKQLYYIALIVFLIGTEEAQADVTAATALNNKLHATQSMQAKFTQTTTNERGKILQRSTGSMAFLRPGQFRWEVKTPIPQLILINGNQLKIYDPDLAQLTIRSLQAAQTTPALLLSNSYTDLDKHFQVTAKSKDSYTLQPKNRDNLFVQLTFYFSGNHLTNLQFVDELGNHTHIRFQAMQINLSLPRSLFQLKVPRGTDILDETVRKGR